MTFQEHIVAANAMTRPQAEAELESLAAVDPRFRSVLKVLIDDWNSYSVAVVGQNLAGDHGKLAHCAGSMHALTVVMEQLRRAVTPPGETAQPMPD